MALEPKSLNRASDTPRDKPRSERNEHANLDRPGAQAHPHAGGWKRQADPVMSWRLR